MTEDYKKILIDYITDLEPGQSTSAEIFKETEEVLLSEWNSYIPSNYVQLRLEGLIKSKTSDKVIFYGGYFSSGSSYLSGAKGIIIITDSNLKPIQMIDTFSSGTSLRPIQKMLQEEDGQFVAVDSVVMFVPHNNQTVWQAVTSCEKRVLLLNDISRKSDEEYEVNLRRSYILGDGYRNFICRDIFKNPNSSHYCFMGIRITYDSYYNKYNTDGVRIISLKINVGSANEWWVKNSNDRYIYGGGFAYFDSNDDVNWKILLTRNVVAENKILVWGGTNTSDNLLATLQDPNYNVYIDTNMYCNQVAFVNQNKAYYVQNNQSWGVSGSPDAKYIGLYEVDLTNNTIKEIYKKSLGNYDYCDKEAIFLQVVNGELYIQYCTNINSNVYEADYYIQRYKDVWEPILVKEGGNFAKSVRMFYVSQTFNLLKINLIPNEFKYYTWYMEQITEVYNITNYNGEEYENYNALIPEYGNIYSNDKIMFSRDIHNLSVTNNYTVASIEVPNTYLNDMTLDLKELVGKTNYVLVDDDKPISKNVYEMLYLNYINTLNVKDNENIVQLNSSKYVNENINVGTEANYNNSKCTKVEIVYDDNTNKIFPIAWERIDDTHKSTEFTIYVDKPILEINLISNDQTTTYITIQRELEEGKYYTFKQYLKVE